MGWKEKDEVVVYWYHLESHNDVMSQGYVGVTSNQKERHWQHTKWVGSNSLVLRKAFEKYGEDSIHKTILLTGSKEECLLEEARLRPAKSIGWNIAIGGGYAPDCTGRKHSEETKAKISRGNKGKNLGKVSPMKGSTGRYSKETLEAIGISQRGKTISKAHREAITFKLSGSKNKAARYIVLIHQSNPTKEFYFGSIIEASLGTGVSRSALKSTIVRQAKTYNKKGWRVLFDKSHPELGQK